MRVFFVLHTLKGCLDRRADPSSVAEGRELRARFHTTGPYSTRGGAWACARERPVTELNNALTIQQKCLPPSPTEAEVHHRHDAVLFAVREFLFPSERGVVTKYGGHVRTAVDSLWPRSPLGPE